MLWHAAQSIRPHAGNGLKARVCWILLDQEEIWRPRRHPLASASLIAGRICLLARFIAEAKRPLACVSGKHTLDERNDFIPREGESQISPFEVSAKWIFFNPADLQASLNSWSHMTVASS